MRATLKIGALLFAALVTDNSGTIKTIEPNGSVVVQGNRDAGDGGGDVLIRGSRTRTSGYTCVFQNNITSVAGVDLNGGIHPGTPAGALQAGALWMGSGAPSNSNGNNGDSYFRTDTPGTANQRLYVKSAGSWVGIL